MTTKIYGDVADIPSATTPLTGAETLGILQSGVTATVSVADLLVLPATFSHVAESLGVVSTQIQAAFDQGLIGVGGCVTTFAYYPDSAHGGAEYRVVASATGTDDGGSYIDFAGFQLQARFGNTASVDQFGALGDDTATDTPQVQAALDWARVGNGGNVFLGPRTYRVGSLTVGSRVTLSGEHPFLSQLRAIASTTTAVVQLFANTVQGVTLKDFMILGELAHTVAVDGVRLQNTTSAINPSVIETYMSDSYHVVKNVTTINMSGNGFTVIGRGATKFYATSALWAIYTGLNGYYIEGFDNHFTDCIAGAPANAGFYQYGGGNNSFTGCKSFLSGEDGFTVVIGGINRFSGCVSQAAGRHGLYIYLSHGNVWESGVLLDSNYEDVSGVGFRIESSNRNIVSTSVAVLEASPRVIAAMTFAGTSTGNNVTITADPTLFTSGWLSGADSTAAGNITSFLTDSYAISNDASSRTLDAAAGDSATTVTELRSVVGDLADTVATFLKDSGA